MASFCKIISASITCAALAGIALTGSAVAQNWVDQTPSRPAGALPFFPGDAPKGQAAAAPSSNNKGAASGPATNSPFIFLYHATGVVDNGGANFTGTATAFSCTNFESVPNNLTIFIWRANGSVAGSATTTLNSLQTVTFTTHATFLYFQNLITTGFVQQGYAQIYATSTLITCSASVVDALAPRASGFDLPMGRANAVPGLSN